MAEKRGVGFPGKFPAGAANDDDDDESNYNIKAENGAQMKKMKGKKKKEGGRKRLLGLLKAVIFETAMVKRLRKRKLKLKNFPSNGNENSSHNKELSSEAADGKIPPNTSSSLQSSSSFIPRSGSSSSLSSNSRLNSDRNSKPSRLSKLERKQKQGNAKVHGKRSDGTSTGFCFLLISILVLITWGKLCAIFCTCAWLFIVPRRRVGNKSLENIGSDSLRLDSDEYKKKITMEGLKETNHSHGL